MKPTPSSLVGKKTARRRFDDDPTTIDLHATPYRHDPAAAFVQSTGVRRLLHSLVGLLPAREPEPVEIEDVRAPLSGEAWRTVRTALILDGLPTDELRPAFERRKVALLSMGRDVLAALDGRVGIVVAGQVALGFFPADALRVEREAQAEAGAGAPTKQEQKRRSKRGPMVRLATRNLCLFEESDLLEPEARPGDRATRAYYAVTPAKVIAIDHALLRRWCAEFGFIDDRFRRAGDFTRRRLANTDGAVGETSDFFVRHGLSVSMTLRVRKLDACFECGACEQACEDRYGVKRLSLNGRVLGGLDFVDACHTCTDARCIDPCNFDSISFDAVKQEVVINEATCTGCTLCAVACPYDAIEMHELDETPLLQIRLDKAGALGFGEGTPRKARLRRIASKCDHCMSYEDQACISACPTGALLEMTPADVAAQLPMVVTPKAVREVAKGGYDESFVMSLEKMQRRDQARAKRRRRALAVSLEMPEFGRARARRTQLSINLWWGLGLFAFAVAVAEIVARKLAPELSLAYLVETLVDGIEPEIALSHIDYRPGCQLAMICGYLGTGLMISTGLYVLRRRIGVFGKLGTLQGWFDWHVMSGVVGPMFVLLHTCAKLDNWISFATWSMVGCVVSGLFGRYLNTHLPTQYSMAPTEIAEVSAELVLLAEVYPGAQIVEEWGDARRHAVGAMEQGWRRKERSPVATALAVLRWILADNMRRRQSRRALGRALRAVALAGAPRRQLVRLAERRALLQRRYATLPLLAPLLNWWKVVHVPMAIGLAVIGSIHIALAWMAS